MPHRGIRQRHRDEPVLAGPDAVFDIVPLEEDRHRQPDLGDHLGRDQAGPPGVVAGVDAAFLVLLQHAGVAQRLRYLLAVLQFVQMHFLGADIQVIRVEQEQHLRTDQRRFDSHIGEGIEPQYRFRFAEDVIVHQDDVGVLVDRGHLVEATGEATRTTEIRLPNVAQLVTEDRQRLLEARLVLHQVGALVHHVDRVDGLENRGVGGQRGHRLGAVRGPVEGADRDGDGAHMIGCGGGPGLRGDAEFAADGIEFEPQRAAVDVLVQRCGQGQRAARGDLGGVDDPAMSGDIGGDQPNAGLLGHIEHHRRPYLGDRGPALPVAGREPSEIGVGVRGCALVQSQLQAFPMGATLDNGIQLVAHLRRRTGEDAALQHQPIGRLMIDAQRCGRRRRSVICLGNGLGSRLIHEVLEIFLVPTGQTRPWMPSRRVRGYQSRSETACPVTGVVPSVMIACY